MAIPFGDDEVPGEVEMGMAGVRKLLVSCRARRSCQSPYAILHTTPHPHPQNNLSNPPTPPSSLPPTPPPSVQQKMVNGVTPSEELGEHPKDATSARDAEGTLRGKSGTE